MSEISYYSEGKEPLRGKGYPIANRDEIIDEICHRLTAGEPMAQICRDAHIPAPQTLWDWGKQDPAIETEISRAREFGADSIAMDALDIADNLTGDPQRDKLRVETRLKLLAKWNPKKYGDNMQLRHADADGGKLDTAPLVNELLGLMPGGAPSAPAQQPIINVTPTRKLSAPKADNATPVIRPAAPLLTPQPPARRSYQPHIKRAAQQALDGSKDDSVEDLV